MDRSQPNSLNLKFLLEAAGSSKAYCEIINALREDKDPRNLPPGHPAKLYQDVWPRLSLFGNDLGTLILLDCERVVLPENCVEKGSGPEGGRGAGSEVPGSSPRLYINR